MLIARDIEQKVMSAIANTIDGIDDIAIRGAWANGSGALARWVQGEDGCRAFVSVACASPSQQVYTASTANLACTIAVFLRYELDPNGELMCALAERLEDLFHAWQSETYQRAFDALDTEDFSIDDVAVDGGASPAIAQGLMTLTYQLTFSGSYLAA